MAKKICFSAALSLESRVLLPVSPHPLAVSGLIQGQCSTGDPADFFWLDLSQFGKSLFFNNRLVS